MAPVVKTAWLAAAVARVTGDRGRPVNEGKRFRVSFLTSDGHKHAVSVQVDTHPKVARPYALNQVADALKIDRGRIVAALDAWTPDQLVAHLERFPKSELMPSHFRSQGS